MLLLLAQMLLLLLAQMLLLLAQMLLLLAQLLLLLTQTLLLLAQMLLLSAQLLLVLAQTLLLLLAQPAGFEQLIKAGRFIKSDRPCQRQYDVFAQVSARRGVDAFSDVRVYSALLLPIRTQLLATGLVKVAGGGCAFTKNASMSKAAASAPRSEASWSASGSAAESGPRSGPVWATRSAARWAPGSARPWARASGPESVAGSGTTSGPR